MHQDARRTPDAGHLRVALAATLLLAALLLAPTGARADLSLQWENVVAQPGTTGTADLVIYNPDAVNYELSSYVVQVVLTGLTGVDLTGVSIPTLTAYDADYVFTDSASLNDPIGVPLSFDSFPTTTFMASDAEGGPGFRVLEAGKTYGLLRVAFAVAANADLGQLGALGLDLDFTSLANGDGTDVLAFGSTPASFSVSAAPPSVPEPATVGGAVLATLAGLAVAGLRRRGRPRRAMPAA